MEQPPVAHPAEVVPPPRPAAGDASSALPPASVFGVRWIDQPAHRDLLPGSAIKWEFTSTHEVLKTQFLVEGDEEARVICGEARGICWLPPELPAASQLTWWLRVQTEQGIVRSAAFPFSTPDVDIKLDVGRVGSRVPSDLLLSWRVDRGTPAAVMALAVSPNGHSAACSGASGCMLRGLLPGERYNVHVQAVDARGLYTEYALGAVTVNRPPAEATAISPVVGSEVAAGTVSLRWSDAADAEADKIQYRVEVHRGGGTPHVHDVVGRSFDIRADAGEVIHWRVEARDALGASRHSAYFHFKTPSSVPTALPLAPAQDQVLPPRAPVGFQWAGVGAGVSKVELRPLGGEWFRACEGLAACTLTTPLQAGKTYEWRVSTSAGYYGSATGAVRSFQTAPPVVLVHGILSDGRTWGPDGGELRRRGFEVIDFDPTAGTQPLSYTPPDASTGLPATARHVRAAMDAKIASHGYPRGEAIAIVGHSMGGLVGRSIANEPGNYPVIGLVTLGSPHLGSTSGVVLQEILPRAADWLCTWVLTFLAGIGAACSVIVPLVIESYKDRWAGAIEDLAPWSEALRSLNSRPTATPYLAVAGLDDFLVGPGSATYGSAEQRVVPGGHTALPRSPAAFDAVEEWLLARR